MTPSTTANGYSPNVDALEEVKVLTGNAAADYGNAGGAAVMMSIKSGTNQFHGNVFEFLQNDKLNANGFFRNRNVSTATRSASSATSSAAPSVARSSVTRPSSSSTTKAPSSAQAALHRPAWRQPRGVSAT